MIDIVEGLHKYVPKATQDENNSSTTDEMLYPICIRGDQLSVSRYRGSAQIWSKRLEGLFGVIEDWHTQVTL